jgi:CSLREA domain-containing protein
MNQPLRQSASRFFSSPLLCGVFLIAIIACLLSAPPSASMMATFTVNSVVDTVDALPGDGICADATGNCTLRAAIMEANALAGADTISVPAGTYTLTLPATPLTYDQERLLSTGARQTGGDLDILGSDLTIVGASPATTIIQAGVTTATGIDRIFDVNNPKGGPGIGIDVRLENLTLRNGNSPSEPPTNFRHTGGAIQFDGFDLTAGLPKGKLTIRNCVITANQAAGTGGAIRASFGSLDIDGSVISGNTSLNGAGGAIMYDGGSQSATQFLSITNSTISGNSAPIATFGSGGGIFATGNASFLFENNTFLNNSAAADGGAIAAVGFAAGKTKTINKNRIENNSALRGDGVFSSNSTASVSPLTFTLNAVVGNGSTSGDTGLFSTTNTGGDMIANNWWGCNEGPNFGLCDRIGGAVGFGSGPWLMLSHVATPNTISINGSTTLQADFFTPSLGSALTASDLVALNGRAIVFNNAVLGSISGADTQISGGKANATFTAGSTSGNGSADATVDHATATALISIQEAPGITCPSDIVTTTDPGLCSASVAFSATATGNPTPTITYRIGATVITSPHTFPEGTTTVTATASNGVGTDSTCSFTVTVNDDEAPSISCPSNITRNSDPGTCGAVVSYTAPTGTDNCPGATTTQTAGLPSGSTFPVGTTTNTFKVTDAAGHEATCSFTVTVEDHEKPVVTVPANIVVSTDPNTCSAVVTFNATATDNCAGVTVMSSPASGSTFPKGTTTVTSTATDASGNQDSKTFTVTVNDTQAPSITCPANIVVDAPQGSCSAQVNFTITAQDNCPGTVTVGSSPASGSVFPVGTTTVNASATDASGNTATCMFTVTVRDATAPTITLNGQTPVLWPPNHDYHTINVTDLVASASDLCDAGVDISDVVIAQVSSDELEDSGADGSTLNDIVIAADCKSVQLRAERQASGNGRVYTITFRVRDAGGNTATVTGQVIVPETSATSGAVNGPGPGYTVASGCP